MTRLGLNLLTSEPAAQDAEMIQTLATGKGVRLPDQQQAYQGAKGGWQQLFATWSRSWRG